VTGRRLRSVEDADQVVDKLYAVPPDDFVRARDAEAKRLRGNGDAALAKEVKALRRPSQSAWLVNELSRKHESEVTELLGLAEQVRGHGVTAEDLRRVANRRRELIEQLTRHAVALGTEDGRSPSDTVVAEIGSTLNAASADPDVAADVAAGRVTRAAHYAGFGPELAFAPTSDASSKTAPRTRSARDDDTSDGRADAAGQKDEKRGKVRAASGDARTERAKSALEAAEAKLAEREEEWHEARQAEQDRRREVRDLRRKLEVAERDLAAAERALDSVSHRRDRAHVDVDRARQALRRLDKDS